MACLKRIWNALFGGVGDGIFCSKFARLIIAIVLINPAVSTPADAATIQVDGGSSGCSDDDGTPYCKIQAAIDDAVDDDTVLVAPGTYQENLNFLGKAITVRSHQGAAVTIIDGGALDTVAYFGNDETTASVLDGFTLQNGFARNDSPNSQGDGGGVCIKDSSPTIKNNIIRDNIADHPGFGIEIHFGSPIIDGNTIINNAPSGNIHGGGGGGGIEIGGASTALIINNTISNNRARPDFISGGGIYMNAAGTPTIRNNLISENESRFGGGIAMSNASQPLIVQNIIRDNSAEDEGGGIHWVVPSGFGPIAVNNTIVNNFSPEGSGLYADSDGAELTNNVVVALPGQVAIYCDKTEMPIMNSNNIYGESGTAYHGSCTDLTGENGNISEDPLFVDATANDFVINPDSPVIGAGDSDDPNLPADDFAGNARIEGSDVDMGAYEFHPNPGILEFSIDTISVGEGDGSATIAVRRKAGRTGRVTVIVYSDDVTAESMDDYRTVAEVISFADGDMDDKIVTVSIFDDSIDESMIETLTLSLNSPSGGATLGSITSAELGIMDNERSSYDSDSGLPDSSDKVCFIMAITN